MKVSKRKFTSTDWYFWYAFSSQRPSESSLQVKPSFMGKCKKIKQKISLLKLEDLISNQSLIKLKKIEQKGQQFNKSQIILSIIFIKKTKVTKIDKCFQTQLNFPQNQFPIKLKQLKLNKYQRKLKINLVQNRNKN